MQTDSLMAKSLGRHINFKTASGSLHDTVRTLIGFPHIGVISHLCPLYPEGAITSPRSQVFAGDQTGQPGGK